MSRFDCSLQKLSATDAVISIALLGICASIFLPAIQRVRSTARGVTCESRLIAIGVDAYVHDATTGRIPSYLGAPGAVLHEEFAHQNESPNYWQHQQGASPLAQGAWRSGRLQELTGSRRPIDVRFWDFENSLQKSGLRRSELEGWNEISQVRAPIFLCPSLQEFYPTTQYGTFPQPVWFEENTVDDESLHLGSRPHTGGNHKSFNVTHYAGCLGAAAGASNRVEELAAFRGMITSRESQSLDDIADADGLTNSIMYGETIGRQRRPSWTPARQVDTIHVWLTGGVVRGRGDTPWMESVSDEPTTDYPNGGDPISGPLGRLGFSSAVGFGSGHRAGVNFVFGDGHVAQLTRQTDVLTLYSLFGAYDTESPDF